MDGWVEGGSVVEGEGRTFEQVLSLWRLLAHSVSPASGQYDKRDTMPDLAFFNVQNSYLEYYTHMRTALLLHIDSAVADAEYSLLLICYKRSYSFR